MSKLRLKGTRDFIQSRKLKVLLTESKIILSDYLQTKMPLPYHITIEELPGSALGSSYNINSKKGCKTVVTSLPPNVFP